MFLFVSNLVSLHRFANTILYTPKDVGSENMMCALSLLFFPLSLRLNDAWMAERSMLLPLTYFQHDIQAVLSGWHSCLAWLEICVPPKHIKFLSTSYDLLVATFGWPTLGNKEVLNQNLLIQITCELRSDMENKRNMFTAHAHVRASSQKRKRADVFTVTPLFPGGVA